MGELCIEEGRACNDEAAETAYRVGTDETEETPYLTKELWNPT